jgi:hypothetical protein
MEYFAGEQVHRNQFPIAGGIRQSLERLDLRRRNVYGLNQARRHRVGDIHEMEPTTARRHRCDLEPRVNSNVEIFSGEIKLPEHDRVVELARVDDRQPVGAGSDIGHLPLAIKCRALDHDLPRLAAQRQRGNNTRRKRAPAKRIETLFNLGEVINAITVGIGRLK